MIIETFKKIQNPSNAKKSSNNRTTKTKFTLNENESIDHSTTVSAMNPFLFLQEIDEYKENQKTLKESGDKILKSLNEIRFGLINGELEENHIVNLKNLLENNKVKFKFLELQEVINDIILRSEVELAKIEFNSNKNTA